MAFTTRAKARPAATASCAGCQATWKADGAAHCASCHTTWASVTDFDEHRPKGICLAIPKKVPQNGTSTCDQNGTDVILPVASSKSETTPRGEARMAKHTQVTLVDDLNGEEADETLDFGLDGKQYEIDLSDKNAARLREFLAEFVSGARASGRTVKPRGSSRSSGNGESARNRTDREASQEKRDWARERGMKVSDRGRIPAEVLEAYALAHPS